MAAIVADRIVVEIEAKIDGYKRQVQDAERQFGRSMAAIEASAKRAERSAAGALNTVGESATRNAALFSRAGVLIGTSAGVIAGSMVAGAVAAIQYAANLAEVARQSGTTVEQLQILQRAGIANGFSMNEAASAIENLNQKLGEAKSNLSGEAARNLFSIGITREQVVSLRTGADLLPIIADRIQEMRTQSEQAAAAERNGLSALLPLLQRGADGYRQYADEARNAGLVTEEQARRAEEARQRLDNLANTLRTNLTSGFLTALEYSENFTASLDRLADRAGNAAQSLLRMLGVQQQANTFPEAANAGQSILSRAARYNPVTAPISLLGDMLTTPANGVIADIVSQVNQLAGQSRTAGQGVGGRALGSNAAPARARHGRSGPSAEEIARREAEAERRFQYELAQLQGDLLDALQIRATSAQQIADFEIQQIEAQRDRENANYEAEARNARTNRDIASARAQQLIEANNAVAAERIRNAELRRDEEIVRQQIRASQATLDNETELEQLRGRIAETRQQQRDSELALLDLSQERERTEISRMLTLQTLDDTERQILEERLRYLDRVKDAQTGVILRETESPRDRYLRQINRTGEQMNDDLDEVAISGFQRLNEELSDSITGFLKLGGVAGRVLNSILSDLLKIAIQQAIIKPLANALFGGGINFGGFKAAGGPVAAGVPYVVGEKGPELFVPNGSGTIVPHQASFSAPPSLHAPAGGPAALTVNVTVNAQDAVLTETVKGWIAQGVSYGIAEASPKIQAGAVASTFQRLRRPSLNSR